MQMQSLSGAIAAVIFLTQNPDAVNAQSCADAVGVSIGKKPSSLPIVEHTTGKGKVIRGVIRTDLNHAQAKEIDPYTFRKSGGFFIREKYLSEMGDVAFTPEASSVEGGVQKAQEQTEEQKQAIAQEQAAAKQEQARARSAERLRGVADKMLADAQGELGRERLTNTHKRAREAASSIADATRASGIAKTMGNLADAIASGQADKLAGLTSRTQVELLDSMLRRAQYERWIAEGKNHTEKERLKGSPLTEQDVAFTKMPEVFMHRGHGRDIAAALAGKKGYVKASAWAYSKIGSAWSDDNVYTLSPSEYDMAKTVIKGMESVGKKQTVWQLVEGMARIDRLGRMGIKNTNDLHAALKEYLQFRDGGIKEDPVKAAERKLVGQKVGIDFFPTPKSLAQRMVELAGIEQGDRVLEPSAGSGNIADAAKAAGAKVDTIEVSHQLRELLGLKGHTVIGHDFEMEDYSGRYYDAVLMNPPFSDRKDALHIMRAFDLLKKGGTLVAIAGEGVFFGSDAKAVGFRDWLKEHKAHIEKLPEGTFMDKTLLATTGANARLIVMTRRTATGDVTSDDHLQDTGKGDDLDRQIAEAELAVKALDEEISAATAIADNPDQRTAQQLVSEGFEPYRALGENGFIESALQDKLYLGRRIASIRGRNPTSDVVFIIDQRGDASIFIRHAQVNPQSDDAFALAAQTEEDRRQKEAADKAALAKEEQERIAAERKAKADRDAADFQLTGSNRPADVAMAAGQADLFSPMTRGQKEAAKNLPKAEDTISDADYAQVVEAAKYLKDIVYSLDNLLGDDKRLLLSLSSPLGKSGRDTILMDTFGIDRNLAHTIHNRMDDSKPHKLRDIDMTDAFDTFPMLKKIIDDVKEELRLRDERKAAKEVKKAEPQAAGAAGADDLKTDVVVDDDLLEIGKADTKKSPSDVSYALRMDQQGVMPGKLTYLNEYIKTGRFSIDDVSASWEKTRAYIRKKHGNVVGLYRADAPKNEHHPDTTILLMGDKKLASRFALDGRKMKRFRVSVDDIVGLNVTPSGYYEFLVKKPVQDEQAAGDDMDPNSPNYRYRDTGYVAATRKEQAQSQIRIARDSGHQVTLQMIDWEAIEENPRVAKELIIKSNLFGKVDWEALKAAGMTPEAGFLIDRVYASIAPEPEGEGTQTRRNYALALQSLRDRLESCKTVQQVTDVLEEVREELTGFQLSSDEEAEYTALDEQYSALVKEEQALEDQSKEPYSRQQQSWSEMLLLEREADKRARRGWKPEPGSAEKIAAAKKQHADDERVWRDILNANKPRREEIRQQRTELSKQRRTIKENAQKRNLMESPATLGWITFGKRFFSLLHWRRSSGSDTFAGHVVNAKAGRIGGWEWAEKDRATKTVKEPTKKEVRFHLKVTEQFDRKGGKPVSVVTTEDLQKTFGLRHIVSGNWVLKDPLSAKFHVENAAGAFLDMGDMLGIDPSVLGLGGRLALGFGAFGKGNAGFGGAAAAHYDPTHRVINLTKMKGGGALGHEYFHALDNLIHEMVNGKVSEKGDQFVSITPELVPAGPLRDAFAELRVAMLTGTVRLNESITLKPNDKRLAAHNIDTPRASPIAQAIKDAGGIEAAVMAVKTKLMPTDKRREKIRNDWIRIAVAYYSPEGTTEVMVPTGPKVSSFKAEAVILDQGVTDKYWSQSNEMASRAFQAYLEDRLASADRRNDYLSAYADNKHYVDPFEGDKKPFPEGEERKRINAAFDKMFDVIRSQQILEKAAANKPLMDAMFPDFDPESEIAEILSQLVA